MRYVKYVNDKDMIRKVLSIEDMYNSVKYDGSPKLDEYDPTGVWFILMDGKDTAGVIKLDQMTNVLWSPHIYILKKYRGFGSTEWGKQVFDYMTKVVGAKKFLALTPYRAALKYAEKIGFKYVTTIRHSIKKDGKLMDQYLLEGGIE